MTYEEAIKAIRLDGLSIEAKANRMLEFSQGLALAEETFENAERYKWHNLRKNPNDLPEENDKEYLCIKKDFQYDFFEFNTEYNCFGYIASMIHEELDSCPTESWFEGTDEEIIAWKYIEPFEDVEE